MALIMLVIISFAGLLAARNSANYEQFSNNMRTNQVARVAAENALRYCERVAIYSADDEAEENSELEAAQTKIVATAIADDEISSIQGAEWNKRSNWASGANLITVTQSYGDKVQDTDGKNPRLKNPPTCIVQAMVNDRFLVTARGLSSDATVSTTNGTLTSGSEVWLQSILTPSVTVLSANKGIE